MFKGVIRWWVNVLSFYLSIVSNVAKKIVWKSMVDPFFMCVFYFTVDKSQHNIKFNIYILKISATRFKDIVKSGLKFQFQVIVVGCFIVYIVYLREITEKICWFWRFLSSFELFFYFWSKSDEWVLWKTLLG